MLWRNSQHQVVERYVERECDRDERLDANAASTAAAFDSTNRARAESGFLIKRDLVPTSRLAFPSDARRDCSAKPRPTLRSVIFSGGVQRHERTLTAGRQVGNTERRNRSDCFRADSNEYCHSLERNDESKRRMARGKPRPDAMRAVVLAWFVIATLCCVALVSTLLELSTP